MPAVSSTESSAPADTATTPETSSTATEPAASATEPAAEPTAEPTPAPKEVSITNIPADAIASEPELDSFKITYTDPKTNSEVTEDIHDAHIGWNTPYTADIAVNMTKVKEDLKNFHVKDDKGNVVDDSKVVVDPNHSTDDLPAFEATYSFTLQDSKPKNWLLDPTLQEEDKDREVVSLGYAYALNAVGSGPSKKAITNTLTFSFKKNLETYRAANATITLADLKAHLLSSISDVFHVHIKGLATVPDPQNGKAFNEGTKLITDEAIAHSGRIVTEVVKAPQKPTEPSAPSASAGAVKANTTGEVTTTDMHTAEAPAPKAAPVAASRKVLPQTGDVSIPYGIVALLGSIVSAYGLKRRR